MSKMQEGLLVKLSMITCEIINDYFRLEWPSSLFTMIKKNLISVSLDKLR